MTNKILLYLSGTIFAVYLFFVAVLANLSYLFDLQLTYYIIVGAVLLSGFYTAVLINKLFPNLTYQLLLIIPVLTLIFGISYGVAINRGLYDLSFDGQAYQGEAVYSLIEGWNPILDPDSREFSDFPENGSHDRWLNAYPKASWYNSTAIHRLTGDFRDTKFFGISLVIGSFLVILSVLNYFKFSENSLSDNSIKSILALFLTFNPVALTQATTLNLDGQIYSMLVILFATLFHLYKSYEMDSKFSNFFYINTAIILIVIFNIKTAGLVYGVMFFLAYAGFSLVTNLSQWRKLTVTFITSIILGVGVLGFNPYITNIFIYENPLFPQFGPDKFSYIENTPSNYRSKKNIEIFISSLFFKTDETFLDGEGEAAELKLPFTIYESEIDSLKNSQLKKGGFGPLFSGSLILGIIGLAAGLVSKYKELISNNVYQKTKINPNNIKPIVAITFFSIVLGVSFLLTSTSNTFRYIPHLWSLLGVWITFSMLTKSGIARFVSTLALVVGFINIGLISGVYFNHQITQSNQYTSNINELVKTGETYEFYFDYHTASRGILNENNIPYKYSNSPVNCPDLREDLSRSIHGIINLTKGCVITEN